MPLIDESLPKWSTLARGSWPTLLLGNGFSVNIWDGFRYDSLFNQASLSESTRSVFTGLVTTNFETALECLHHAHLVLKCLGKNTSAVDRTYAEIRDALFDAVKAAHVPWEELPYVSCTTIASALAKHTSVFTTNYDLLLYWSHMESAKPVNLKDYFWNSDNTFDPANVSSGATLIHYLHGGLHLWADDATGENGKWTTKNERLLDIANRYEAETYRRPLFISEGTSEAKLRSIRQSNYLSFCLDRLRNDSANTVVFGHSLSGQDSHIIEALNAGFKRRIAISVHPGGGASQIIREKARMQDLLDRQKVVFYDSTTHPLGGLQLHISTTTAFGRAT
jgi:hypothetical protein